MHESLDYLLYKLPVLTVYYEDYQQPHFMDTAQSVLAFLELEVVAGGKRGNVKWAEFVPRIRDTSTTMCVYIIIYAILIY